jgi:hypothetical protein
MYSTYILTFSKYYNLLIHFGNVIPISKDIIMFFQLELDNQNLRMINQNQTEEIRTIQSKLQGTDISLR